MATELSDGVWRIACRGVNAYLLDREEVVLVDAGTPIDAGRISAGVREAGHEPGDVDRVLVTHFDVDHVGALWRLDLDATVHMSDPDASFLVRQRAPPLSGKGLFQRAIRPLVRPPGLPVERVADGDAFAGLTAHHTPGHTPGHTVYADGDVAFLGDLAMADDGALRVPPGFLNYETARVERSVREFAERGPDFAVAATGHGDPLVEGGGEALRTLAATLDES